MARTMHDTWDMRRTLATALREAREDRGLSQDDAAVQIGIPYKTYCNYERGSNLPTYPHFLRLCLFFKWPHPFGKPLPWSEGRHHPPAAAHVA